MAINSEFVPPPLPPPLILLLRLPSTDPYASDEWKFEGDEKTPEGRYTINGRNPKSAFHLSLRISYPNAADTAFAQSKGRSAGGDIFIHGQPNRWIGPTLSSDWTDGCIALSNEEIRLLWKQVDDGTVITIQP